MKFFKALKEKCRKKKLSSTDRLLERQAEKLVKLKEKRVRAEAKLQVYKEKQEELDKLRKAKKELRESKLKKWGIK